MPALRNKEKAPVAVELSAAERLVDAQRKVRAITGRLALRASRLAHAEIRDDHAELALALDELHEADREDSIENGLARFADNLSAPQLANLALTLFESNGRPNGDKIIQTTPEDLETLQAVAVRRAGKTQRPTTAREFLAVKQTITQQADWLRDMDFAPTPNLATLSDISPEIPNPRDEKGPVKTLIAIIEHPTDSSRVLMTEDGRYFEVDYDRATRRTFEETARDAANKRLGVGIKLRRRENAEPSRAIVQRWAATDNVPEPQLEAEGLSWKAISREDQNEASELAETA